MLVFSSAKLVFLSVPKTGSTAYEQALLPVASMVVSAPPELKHAPVFRYNRFYRPALEKFIGTDLEVLAVMREPIDWLGSWYRYRQRPALDGHRSSTKGISFDEFVEAYMKGQRPAFANVGSQAKFLEPQANGTAVTHLFQYEDPDGLNGFLEGRLGVNLKTDRLNSSPKMTLELSEKTAQKFRRKCGDEYRLWSSIKGDGRYTPLEG
ncbi:gamma-glutamyl kinase [Roseovarius sp. 2305UL8-3]|uniref:gamma-glutamyl kinase n=1 Tax=Roseovarius conchicola TaxID=3121636 RepID=UPI003528D909